MNLKPCHHCKGEGIPDKVLRDGYGGMESDPDAWAHFIICRSCAAQGGWSKSLSGAIRNWNMRAGEDELVEACQVVYDWLQDRGKHAPVLLSSESKLMRILNEVLQKHQND